MAEEGATPAVIATPEEEEVPEGTMPETNPEEGEETEPEASPLQTQLEPRGALQFATYQDAQNFVVEKEATIPLDRVVFDTRKRHGQIRKLTNSVVNYYYQQLLTKGPPTLPPTIPLKRLTGDKYVPLGGQHITAALVQLRQKVMQKTAEENLPTSLRVVRGTVYSTETPLAVCRAVAGHHQSTQHDVRESSIADTCGYILDLQKEKVVSSGTALMNDEEIFQALENFGLIRGSEKALAKGPGEMTMKDAALIARQQKNNEVNLWRNFFYFLAANVDADVELVGKIAEINRGKEGEILKPQLLREVNAMTAEDWKSFGSWLRELGSTPKKHDIVAKLNALKYHRLAKWHVYQAPEEIVPLDKKTEDTVQLVLQKVPPSALLTTNWGGKVWKALKTSGASPSWERLSQSKIWVDTTQFAALHRQLRGVVGVSRAEKAAAVATAKGKVQRVSIQLGEARTKMFMWGPLAGLASLQRPDVLWVECSSSLTGPTNPEVLEYIKEEPLIPLVALGDPLDVNGLMVQLDASPDRQRQPHSLVYIHVDQEPTFGPKQPTHKSKTLAMLVMGAVRKLQSHFPFVVLRNLEFCMSIVDYAFYILGLTARDFDQHIVYCTHPSRLPEDILQRCAYLMTVIPGWTVSLLPPTDFPTDESTVSAALTAQTEPLWDNDAKVRQRAHETKLMLEGTILNTTTVQYKTERELLEEKKLEMQRRKIVAKAELKEKRDGAEEAQLVESESETEMEQMARMLQQPPLQPGTRSTSRSSSRPSVSTPSPAASPALPPAQRTSPPPPAMELPKVKATVSREEHRRRKEELKRKALEMEEDIPSQPPQKTLPKKPPTSRPPPRPKFEPPRRKKKKEAEEEQLDFELPEAD